MHGWEVRPRTPRRRRWVWPLLVLGGLPLAFWLGSIWRPAPVGPVSPVEAAGSAELEQRMAVLQSAEQLSRQAEERNRQTIKQLEQQIYQLQQELAVYKNVVAPGSRRDGLRIRDLEVHPTADPKVFRYGIMLSRVGADETPLKGTLQVMVEGKSDGKKRSLPLVEVSTELKSQLIPFSFRHFQALPQAGRFAEMRLPENFEPETLVVRAQVEGQKEPIERSFKWTAVE